MQAKELGSIGELKFAAEALHHGYVVLRPMIDIRPYDFVLEKRGRFIKIQVKSNFSLPDDQKSFKFKISRGASTNHTRPYTASEIDFFALYLSHLRSFYLIPYAFCKNKKVIRAFPFGRKNILKPFKNNWDL